MDVAHEGLFIFGIVLLASILAGRLSARIGAPLLLVFLGLGILAGEAGPLGIHIADLRTAYLIGGAALSIILLDGGMRARRATLRLALQPALALASVGVVVTAACAGIAAHYALGVGWLEGFLVGSIVGSTDAAAVFLILHHRGTRIGDRINAVLETESGFNDPVAIFLTASLVEAIAAGGIPSPLALAANLAMVMGVGTFIGLVGGSVLVRIVNDIELAPGLYPILVFAAAIAIFAGTQLLGGSGYLAVYLTGLVLGNSKLRAARLIARFFDGLAWLAQIVLFVMLGLLIHLPDLTAQGGPALIIAAVLILVARPAAVWLCLTPFRFTAAERAFIAWTGLRGAVPIFLAMFPLIAGIPGASTIFGVAFVVVLASLIIQGWTVIPAMRWLRLELPAAPVPTELLEFDLPRGFGREVSAYRVAAGAPALDHDFAALHLPKETHIIAALREGTVLRNETLDRLRADDVVLAIVPPEQIHLLDNLFAARRAISAGETPLGDFMVEAGTPAGEFADLYGLPAQIEERDMSLGAIVLARLARPAAIGDRVPFGAVDLVVHDMDEDRISQIGIILEPDELPLERWRLRPRLRQALDRLRRWSVKIGLRT